MPRLTAVLFVAAALSVPPARADDDPEPPRRAVTLEAILKSCPKDEDAVEKLFQARLGRKPNEVEAKALQEHLRKKVGGRLKAFKDVEWAITNSREYLDRQKAKGKKPK